MKTIYFDCFSGISGDMTLGALVDIGVPREYLINELKKLNIDEEFTLEFKTTQKMGITGTKANVVLHNQHEHHHDSDHHHHHRHLKNIEEIINGSNISSRAKEWSIEIFKKVAEAEAKIHGTTIEKVHFHEVGATDSIVDIVGAAVCIDYLNPDKIIASKVEVGGGFVKCAHGLFPVPAPATTEILTGIPCTYGKVDSETTTPTGAAILTAMVDEFVSSPALTADKIGYGLGFKDFNIPNVLRVILSESVTAEKNIEENLLIECNLDDMNPEDFRTVMDKVMDAGALDVYLTPVIMKKQRSATKISVLLKNTLKDEILNILFKNTTTFGVRILKVEKAMLDREIRSISTRYGEIRVKIEKGTNGNGKWKPEYDDLVKLSEDSGLSLPELRVKIIGEIEKQL